MAYSLDDLVAIIKSITNRLKNLELATYSYGKQPDSPPVNLTVTNLAATVTYYTEPVTGLPKALAQWSWTAPSANSDDPVVDYMVSLTRSTDVVVAGYTSTNGTTSISSSGLPVNINQTARVFAVTEKGIEGPVASATVTITKSTTPPPQPSTPIITAGVKSVVVKTSGLDSAAGAMPSDVAYYNLHAATGVSDTFTPTTANLYGTIPPVGSTVILGNDNYDPIYVRVVAVNQSGLTSSPSTGVHATPIKTVSSDLDVVLPGSKSYSDVGNYIIDGSFEDTTTFSKRTNKSSGWSLDTTAGMPYRGTTVLKSTGDATATKYIYLHHSTYGGQLTNLQVVPAQKYYLSMFVRGVSANGTFGITVWWFKQDGTVATTASTESSWAHSGTGDYDIYETVVQAPDNAVMASVSVWTNTQTTGAVYFDGVTVKPVVTSMLIEDGAITRAKIGYAAITTAQIDFIDAAVIQTGYLKNSLFEGNSISGNILMINSVGTSQLSTDVGSQLDLSGNSDITNKALASDLDTVETAITSLGTSVNNLTNSVVISGAGVQISKPGSPFKVGIDNDSLDFIENNYIVAYVNGQKMYITTVEITQSLIVGVHEIRKYDANNTIVRFMG